MSSGPSLGVCKRCNQVAPANSLMPGKAAALRPGPRSLQWDQSVRCTGHQADRCSARRRRRASASGGPAAAAATRSAEANQLRMVRAPGAELVQAGRLSRRGLLPASCFSVWLAPAPHMQSSSEQHSKMAASRHSQPKLDSEIERS
ncbi:hypothetical protein NDU88_000883 [Pleurodeles waltl]|uniref:Uncharacterized protein n=1 Tax=Pleurodeles waltl TaxID=8319 RepID=A0AAV7R837_PLEWA|nr:hypothetical protein NDU88_000883 [Pleurodeles waltl]